MENKNDRLRKLEEFLKIKTASTVKELSSALDVSEMTIRRDLMILANKNIVKLIHGGVIYNPLGMLPDEKDPNRYSLEQEETEHRDEKRRIAERAVSMINDEDIIIIDSGTTTEFMAEYIQQSSPSVIICYSLNILYSIYRKKEYKIIFGGGYFHENTMMFESKESVELIKNNRANKVFMSARGISDTLGITTADSYEIEMKKAAMDSSQQKILLADSSKFDKIRAAYYSDLADFDMVITDKNMPVKYIKILNDLGVELVMV